MTEHCGIGAWAQNSRIVHAVASTPSAGFKRTQVVREVFSHEPMLARAPSGEYVMYFTSNRANQTHGACNCCRPGKSKCDGSTGPGDCPARARPSARPGAPRDSSPTWMSYAAAPEGPWSEPQQVFPGWHGSDTNFAPLILQNGSLLGLWRSWEATGSRVFLASAPDWRNVSSYVQHHEEVVSVGLGTAGTEDPFLYLDEGGGCVGEVHSCTDSAKSSHGGGHFLRSQVPCGLPPYVRRGHGHRVVARHVWRARLLDGRGALGVRRRGVGQREPPEGPGGAPASAGNLPYRTVGTNRFNSTHPPGAPSLIWQVHFSDGSDFVFTRRERPHLLFDEAGAPTFLASAAQYGTGEDPGTTGDNGDASYTMLQPIRGKKRSG
jgi:hypothetical protein